VLPHRVGLTRGQMREGKPGPRFFAAPGSLLTQLQAKSSEQTLTLSALRAKAGSCCQARQHPLPQPRRGAVAAHFLGLCGDPPPADDAGHNLGQRCLEFSIAPGGCVLCPALFVACEDVHSMHQASWLAGEARIATAACGIG
jgi:hypothetical protein